jgi:hypothetical protein
MNKEETATGGHTARNIPRKSPRKGFSLLALTCLLALVVWLPTLSTPALGQDSCQEDCFLALQICKGQPHPPVSCDDAYAACMEGCAGW